MHRASKPAAESTASPREPTPAVQRFGLCRPDARAYSFDARTRHGHARAVTRAQVILAWHRLRFENQWLRLAGADFQRFFEDIMAKSAPDFLPVTPSGKEGDHKSDGYIPAAKHHFQVYAPSTGIDAGRTCAKINEDFNGILFYWPDMRMWTFVWSTPRGGLPPDVIHLIDELARADEQVAIDSWGLEPLWRQVRELSDSDREALLGFAPGPEYITRIDSSDVLSMLTTLAARPIPAPEVLDFSLTEVGQKMERNGLGDGVRLLLTASYGLAPDVRKYLGAHPDASFPDRVAQSLKDLYRSLEAEFEGHPDALFGALIEAVAAPDGPTTPRYWAAAAIIGYSFELCDIFKR